MPFAHFQFICLFGDGIGSQWRQFRFLVGAPDKEAKFKHALEQETHGDSNAKNYPTLYVCFLVLSSGAIF
jgi:hypothetical protein